MGGIFKPKPQAATASRDVVPLPLPPFTGDPALTAALPHLESGNFEGLRPLLEDRDLQVRYFYTMQLAEHVTREQATSWRANFPDSRGAQLLGAAQGLQWAWQARSNNVTVRDPAEFERRLAVIESEIRELLLGDQSDPNAHALFFLWAKATDSMEVARGAFEVSRPHLRGHYQSHRTFMDGVLQKWGGSPLECVQFAKDVMQGGPDGTDMACLVAGALLEEWLYYEVFERNSQAADQFAEQPWVLPLTKEAYRRSLGAPNYQALPSSIFPQNEFAMWLYLARQPELLRNVLARIGGRVTKFPWAMMGDPGKHFAKARRMAGLD